MKPCQFNAMTSGNFLQVIDYDVNTTITSIKGSVKKLGENYIRSTIMLYSKANLALIAVRKPNAQGNYEFPGLNNSLNCFVIAFDDQKQFNAVIQDNVVPK